MAYVGAFKLGNKMDYLDDIFDRMAYALRDTYEVVGSCNRDRSRYLIPKGSLKDLTYYGKPAHSFRVSDHWNWYASLDRCSEPHYVQCFTYDMPWTQKRVKEGKKSPVIFGAAIAFYDGEDDEYHVVAGEVFDRKKKQWSWVAVDPGRVNKYLLTILKGEN